MTLLWHSSDYLQLFRDPECKVPLFLPFQCRQWPREELIFSRFDTFYVHWHTERAGVSFVRKRAPATPCRLHAARIDRKLRLNWGVVARSRHGLERVLVLEDGGPSPRADCASPNALGLGLILCSINRKLLHEDRGGLGAAPEMAVFFSRSTAGVHRAIAWW